MTSRHALSPWMVSAMCALSSPARCRARTSSSSSSVRLPGTGPSCSGSAQIETAPGMRAASMVMVVLVPFATCRNSFTASTGAGGLLLEQPVYCSQRLGRRADVRGRAGRILARALTIQPHPLDAEHLRRDDVVMPVGGDVHPVVPANMGQPLERAEVPEIRLVGTNAVGRDEEIERLLEAAMRRLELPIVEVREHAELVAATPELRQERFDVAKWPSRGSSIDERAVAVKCDPPVLMCREHWNLLPFIVRRGF